MTYCYCYYSRLTIIPICLVKRSYRDEGSGVGVGGISGGWKGGISGGRRKGGISSRGVEFRIGGRRRLMLLGNWVLVEFLVVDGGIPSGRVYG